ncbi:hypothetical protein EIP91_004924 [Steccherinum ochraceum]|uniref:Uncharacterized protein n=1 Tax=Steccherinum ochraceum TaxID=92696 RepID=A0A4R0R8K0_9APHY|nr:hypothetical protein EIP91_004924 [Steccherinum ochraceum]
MPTQTPIHIIIHPVKDFGVLVDLNKTSCLYDATGVTFYNRDGTPEEDTTDVSFRPWVYPLGFSKTFGHVQSRSPFAPFAPFLSQLEHQLIDVEDEATVELLKKNTHVIRASSSQVYNASMHRVRESSSSHVIQRGVTTSTCAGAFTKGHSAMLREKNISRRLTTNIDAGMPYRTWERQIDSVENLDVSVRFEQSFVFRLDYLRPEHRTGSGIFRDVLGPLVRFYGHGSVRRPFRESLAVFKQGMYPDFMKWTTYGVTQVLDIIYQQNVLERALNYAHTGHAKVISRSLMGPLYTAASLIDTGFPYFGTVLLISNPTTREVAVDIKFDEWPRHKDRSGAPCSASDKAIRMTYGKRFLRTGSHPKATALGRPPECVGIIRLAYHATIASAGRRTVAFATYYQAQFNVVDTFKRVHAATVDPAKIVVLTCRRALAWYVQEVVTEVKKYVEDAIVDDLKSDEEIVVLHAIKRKAALKTWVEHDHPLSFGHNQSARIALITALAPLAAEGEEPVVTLAASHTRSVSAFSLANTFLSFAGAVGDTSSHKSPLFKENITGTIIALAVRELRDYLLRVALQDRNNVDPLIASGFKDSIRHLKIYVVPGPHPSQYVGHNFKYARPDYWTDVNTVETGHGQAAPVPPLDPVAHAAYVEARSSSSATWNILGIGLSEYRHWLNKQEPPEDFVLPDMHDAKPLVVEVYRWAKKFIAENPRRLSVRLGRHLAYLFYQVAPNVHTKGYSRSPPTGYTLTDAVRMQLWLTLGRKGSVDASILFSMMYIFIVAMIETSSPLRKFAARERNSLGEFGDKHSATLICSPSRAATYAFPSSLATKGICGYNLIRLRVAYATSWTLFYQGKFQDSWRIRSESELNEWLKEIEHSFATTPAGVVSLLQKIFGPVVGTSIAVDAKLVIGSIAGPVIDVRRKRNLAQALKDDEAAAVGGPSDPRRTAVPAPTKRRRTSAQPQDVIEISDDDD